MCVSSPRRRCLHRLPHPRPHPLTCPRHAASTAVTSARRHGQPTTMSAQSIRSASSSSSSSSATSTTTTTTTSAALPEERRRSPPQRAETKPTRRTSGRRRPPLCRRSVVASAQAGRPMDDRRAQCRLLMLVDVCGRGTAGGGGSKINDVEAYIRGN